MENSAGLASCMLDEQTWATKQQPAHLIPQKSSASSKQEACISSCLKSCLLFKKRHFFRKSQLLHTTVWTCCLTRHTVPMADCFKCWVCLAQRTNENMIWFFGVHQAVLDFLEDQWDCMATLLFKPAPPLFGNGERQMKGLHRACVAKPGCFWVGWERKSCSHCQCDSNARNESCESFSDQLFLLGNGWAKVSLFEGEDTCQHCKIGKEKKSAGVDPLSRRFFLA